MLKRMNNPLLPQPQLGVLFALVSTGLFVCVGALVRILSEQIDLFQILLVRQGVFLLVLTPVISTSLDVLMKPNKVGLHLLRIFGAFLALYLGFITLSELPLADATALGFTQVLFVALISKLFLGEAVGFQRSVTVLVGFVGVMLVVQPSFAGATYLYTLTGLISALGAAIAVVCVRQMSKTESRTVLLTYQALFVGLMALVPSLFVWQWPSAMQWLLLLLVGLVSSVAQWFGVSAYKFAEANIVANVEYAKMFYSLVLGYVLFSEVPNEIALLGVGIILISALLPFYVGRLKPKR